MGNAPPPRGPRLAVTCSTIGDCHGGCRRTLVAVAIALFAGGSSIKWIATFGVIYFSGVRLGLDRRLAARALHLATGVTGAWIGTSEFADAAGLAGLVAPLQGLRTWAFTFAFLSIGLTTKFREFVSVGARPFYVFTLGVAVNVALGFVLVLRGLSSFSSAYASVRSDDGICVLHDRYVAASGNCAGHVERLMPAEKFIIMT